MGYIKDIAIFLVFISFIENVLAFGNMKKYIRLFCGIVIIFILFQPISELLGTNINIDEILELNQLKFEMEELNNKINEKDTILSAIEENIVEIVSNEGYELTYMLITPSEEETYDIGGISISIKEKNSEIFVEKISVDDKKSEQQPSVEVTKISEQIASLYNIEQSKVVINIE